MFHAEGAAEATYKLASSSDVLSKRGLCWSLLSRTISRRASKVEALGPQERRPAAMVGDPGWAMRSTLHSKDDADVRKWALSRC